MLDRHPTSRLSQLLTVLGLASLLVLGACGGGGGAPNNPYDPTPPIPKLVVLPASLVAYAGVPAMLTVTSGVAPFSVFSENPSTIAVTQNVSGNTVLLVPNKVIEDVVVQMTFQDAAGQITRLNVLVKPSSIFNALTITPSGGDCGGNLCSGQRGTASVIATTPTGAPLAGRSIRFDVVFGPYGIATTNPATPLVQTLTVVTDTAGQAVVGIQAQVNATTQPAQIRATDVTSGQPQSGNFTIVNNTIPSGSPVTVIPDTATITSALATTCSTGFRIDYYIYGGNPPYTIASTFPDSIVLVNTTVAGSGGYFEAITNGRCVDPLIFTVVDSAGKVATPSPTLVNKAGSGVLPPPSALAVAPASVTDIGCNGKTYSFLLAGGTPPYNITQVTNPTVAGIIISPQVVNAAGGSFAVTYPAVVIPVGTVTTILILDSSVPAITIASRVTCN